MTGASRLEATQPRPGRAVLTLALGKPYYTRLAINFARSFLQWHDGREIELHLITSHPELVPPDLARVRVRAAAEGEFGAGFTTKLHLDRVAPASQTLFVDADCLITGPLEPVFERLAGRPVAVTGRLLTEGHFFGDVPSICRRLGIPGVIEFVGGVYYLEPGAACTAVYETARALERRYDELGLIRLRGLPNEEPLVSIAMVQHGLAPVPDDGTIKGDAMCYPTLLDVDVFRGRSRLLNDPRDPSYFRRGPCTEAHPVIVHFNADHAERDPYLREADRLRRVRADGWPLPLATAYAWTTKTLPDMAGRALKSALRPLYRRLFGVRPIAPSPRM